MKRKVVFYGAFDRYNYGDNLMPILLEMYLKKYHFDKIKDIDFVFSSIKSSDLSVFKCMPTIPMRNLLDIPEGSSVIIVGGEVLGASVGILYTHVQDNPLVTKILRFIRKVSPKLLDVVASYQYDAVWNYPYIPVKKSFKNNVKIIYNTVGGNPSSKQQKNVRDADYITSRDQRTYDHVSKFCDTKLVPDSVLMASNVISPEFLEKNVRSEVKNLLNGNYISVQACPYKVEFSAQQMADELDKASELHGVNVLLLPIGYASGHDDVIFLKKVKNLSRGKFLLLDDLNVWEIMYAIARSKAFYGTSLHGVITAMSFLVPHFSINRSIEKLTSFVQTWSVAPYNNPINIKSISSSYASINAENLRELKISIDIAQNLINESLDDIAKVI
nr:polysaccharide pyruvyl transferase family protein [uncultured Erwinia sp.]